MQQYTDGTKLPGICKQLRQKKTSFFSLINWGVREALLQLSCTLGLLSKR